jgi:hypothetical protein
VLLLGALGTGIAYLLNYGIISAAGATIATTVGYLMPLVAVVAGLVVLGERLTWNEPAGAVIVVGGAALTQMRSGSRRSGSRRSGSRRSGSRRVARADPVPDAGVVGDPAVPVDAHIRAERA